MFSVLFLIELKQLLNLKYMFVKKTNPSISRKQVKCLFWWNRKVGQFNWKKTQKMEKWDQLLLTDWMNKKNGTTPSKHNKITKSRIETDFQSKWKSRTFNTNWYQFPFSGFMKFFLREIRLRNKTLGVFWKVLLLFFYNFEISPVIFQLIDVNIGLKIFKKTTGVLMMKQWKQR